MSAASPAPPESLWRPRVVIPFLAVALIWGSTWLVIKGQAGSVPPSWSVCYRFALAALGTFVLAVLRRDRLALDRQGWTLALDFPTNTPGLAQLLDDLDDKVLDAGGRLYLAKDSRMRPELMGEMYPRLEAFRKLRAEIDPHQVFMSDQARRLHL